MSVRRMVIWNSIPIARWPSRGTNSNGREKESAKDNLEKLHSVGSNWK